MVEAEKGRIGISKEVVAAVAGIAISEIEGIANLHPGEGVFRRGEGMRRYVDTEVEEENVKVTARICVLYGNPIHKVAKQVQTRVKEEIERMTGLQVSGVDVEIQRLVHSDEKAGQDKEEE